ncbi:MAG: prepilin-type N-terminal cleavage/methylation domain-containing protein, partial [Natronospirillum sp.]
MKSDSQGFTLIELIIVIIVIGILAAVISPIMGNQFQAYTDSSRRATLVQQAQSVMQQLEKDLYRAAPNTTDDSPVSGLQTIRLLILSDGTG